MTSQYNTSSWRDDFDLEPGVHPTIAYALQGMRMGHAARLANEKLTAPASAPARWPFPVAPIPVDRKTPPPQHANAKDAPL